MPDLVLHSKRNPQPLIKTKCDDRTEEVWKWAYDENHQIKRVLVETRPVWEEIQSYKDETGVYNVLRMLEDRGEDVSVLDANHGKGFYGDVTDMPDDIHQLHKVGEESKAILEAYNKMLGTDYSIDGFLKAVADGSLDALIKAKTVPVVEKKEVSDDVK